MEQTAGTAKGGHVQNPQDVGHTINITVDGHVQPLRQAHYLVSDLKELCGVSADLELDKVEDGEFRPLKDTDYINVKGGDEFVSHVRRGSAS